jgi:hypothetical protein
MYVSQLRHFFPTLLTHFVQSGRAYGTYLLYKFLAQHRLGHRDESGSRVDLVLELPLQHMARA